jgi:hypothetical protein
MQVGDVLRELESSQDGNLLLGHSLSPLEYIECRVGVRSEDDMVKREFVSVIRREMDLLSNLARLDAHDGRRGVVLRGGESIENRVDVRVRTRLEGEPLGSIQDLQEVVVVHEPEEGERGEVEGGLVGGSGPDGSRHREEVVISEPRRVALPVEVAPDALLRVPTLEVRDRAGIEPQDVPDHAPLRRVEDVDPLREQLSERPSRPLVEAAVARDAERHLGRDDRQLEHLEEAQEVGVGDRIESETRVGGGSAPGLERASLAASILTQ